MRIINVIEDRAIRTRVIYPVKVPVKVDAPVDQIGIGTGRFAARWFGYGRLEQTTPKEVDRVVSPRLLSGSGSRLSHTICNGFPLPFACVQEHHLFPQFAGRIASAPLSFGVPQSYMREEDAISPSQRPTNITPTATLEAELLFAQACDVVASLG